jgi:hypothetical protein
MSLNFPLTRSEVVDWGYETFQKGVALKQNLTDFSYSLGRSAIEIFVPMEKVSSFWRNYTIVSLPLEVLFAGTCGMVCLHYAPLPTTIAFVYWGIKKVWQMPRPLDEKFWAKKNPSPNQ